MNQNLAMIESTDHGIRSEVESKAKPKSDPELIAKPKQEPWDEAVLQACTTERVKLEKEFMACLDADKRVEIAEKLCAKVDSQVLKLW